MSCLGFTNPTQRSQIVSQKACDAKLPWTTPRRSVSRLEAMGRSSDPKIRLVAAGHPSTPLTTLFRLMDDKNDEVRSWVLRNPNVPDTFLIYMREDKNNAIAAFARFLFDTKYPQRVAVDN